jgi:hypothetical protein
MDFTKFGDFKKEEEKEKEEELVMDLLGSNESSEDSVELNTKPLKKVEKAGDLLNLE